jgi:hypothetical protein
MTAGYGHDKQANDGASLASMGSRITDDEQPLQQNCFRQPQMPER